MTKLELFKIVSDQKIVLQNQLSKIEFLTNEQKSTRLELEKTISDNNKLRSEVSSLKDLNHRHKQVIHTMGEAVEKLGLAISH